MRQQNNQSLGWLESTLVDGYVHDWLVAGPYTLPIRTLDNFGSEDFKHQLVRKYHLAKPFQAPPVEQHSFAIADEPHHHHFTWRVMRTLDDHFVDLSGFYPTPHYLCAWAYAEIETPEESQVAFILTTNGPADLWINGEHCHRQADFRDQLPYSQQTTAQLRSGKNQVLVQFEHVAVRACPYVMALKVANVKADLKVSLPTAMPMLERRRRLERLFTLAWLDQDVYHRDDPIKVRWPQELPFATEICIRLQTPTGRIYAEARPYIRPGAEVNLGKAHLVPDGAYQVVLMPTPEEYHEHGLRIQHRLNIQVTNSLFAETPVSDIEERRRAALDNAARRNLDLFSEIAKMALGRWNRVKPAVISQALERINSRADCSDFYLIGLLGMVMRFGNQPDFPQVLLPELEACILGFKYWMDEPTPPGSLDAMCYWTENHQILFHTCEILAGQCYPERIFTNNGQSGAWHQAKGEERALGWLHKRAAGGFREWDANGYFQEDVLALTHLADLAENVEVAEMAAVVLDKLFFTLAINSFKGVFGSTHGRTYASLIKGARLEATSGIARLLWGLGAFNAKIRGPVSLACAKSYELPPVIAQIATAIPEELWSRERHAGELEEGCDRATGAWEVNKVTYKTPNFMLCSAQNYQPGELGVHQHIWQATFGPDAVVFVNHPACFSEDNAHRPGFWHGNVVLPRVAQWKDVLVAVHKLPDDDWLGFTHAYFPLHAFDEHTLRDGWAFARKGDGYLALTASCGLQPITTGPSAGRELRSYGAHNIWLVHLGRAALDGSFAEFQNRVLALDVTFDDLTLHATTLRKESIDFGWEGPLLVNEIEEPLGGFKHYNSPYCTAELGDEQMEIQFLDQMVRLDFSTRSSNDQ